MRLFEGYDMWCCFCGGPFANARDDWLDKIESWKEPPDGSLSFTPPPPPSEDVVTISEDDGFFWYEMVCVGPTWDSYVSPRGVPKDDNGTIAFYDDYPWQQEVDHSYFIIHPQCLSFLCRRMNTSPEQIWLTLYSLDPFIRSEFNDSFKGLLRELEYYDINQFHDETYQYCAKKITPKGGGREGQDVWLDPDSMEELQWLLARPTVFPVVPSLSTSVSLPTSTEPITQTPFMRVFNIMELTDIILDFVIGRNVSQAHLVKELEFNNTFTPHSIIQGTSTIFALLQINKTLYTFILRNRQTIFLRLAWMHGWMLPLTPEDWSEWPNGTFHNDTVFEVEDDQDWRAYLLLFLRKENAHVRNRWRFHKMAVQFARRQLGDGVGGGNGDGAEKKERGCWRFDGSELGLRTDPRRPQPWCWEPPEGQNHLC